MTVRHFVWHFHSALFLYPQISVMSQSENTTALSPLGCFRNDGVYEMMLWLWLWESAMSLITHNFEVQLQVLNCASLVYCLFENIINTKSITPLERIYHYSNVTGFRYVLIACIINRTLFTYHKVQLVAELPYKLIECCINLRKYM